MTVRHKNTFSLATLLTLSLALPLTVFPAIHHAQAADEAERGNPLSDKGSWNDLRADIIGDAKPADADGIVELDAPYRAHDAATVPISIKQPGPTAPAINSAILVIDENPAPVAAEMTFGPAMQPLDLELRVRINQYSNVRLIAETANGPVMTGRFVKASGGCSAPATKDPQLALSTMGQIRIKHFAPAVEAASQRREAQLMIRHPNYSGLQRDQITQLFIAAQFINHIEVKQGEDLLFTVDGGISLSENPVIRFAYTDNGAKALTVHVEDTEGNVWDKTLPKEPAS
ncbi:quinoprotein dehydrogenase-associated SoxYZ-like carrier [Roseibium aggregatum]|uniref:quinoprotein dehydrogenase-associated SoxYZ-like carrier n=1 Tax=Roseibium aggregatum TaxID=187304 RepID=UPI001F349CF6|nr:quinoprotein dehydrogenase-associated SoxYZ-like carrier [Roseibium aggregatum]